MLKLQTSFKTFTPYTLNSKKHKQNIVIRSLVLIRGNMQKCLECKGEKRISFGKGGKLSNGFFPIASLYPHLETCKQKGKW